MATPTAKRSPRPKQVEVVDPRWIATALALTLLAALLFAYLTLCALLYQGSWQLMLAPSPKVDKTPSILFEPIRFDAAATGQPRLTGWWIPAFPGAATGPFATPTRTILFLHDGSGSLSSTIPRLELLHTAGVDIFAIDYRGFGHSDPPHPNEARMAEDAQAALDYLEETRHIPAPTIVPYGEGLGAVLAANLANAHADLRGVIIDTPDPDAFARATSSARARLLPMSLLMQEHFDLRAALATSHTPKLLLADGPFGFDGDRVRANQALFRTLPDPKISVTFDNPRSGDAYVQSLTRFFDEYIPK